MRQLRDDELYDFCHKRTFYHFAPPVTLDSAAAWSSDHQPSPRTTIHLPRSCGTSLSPLGAPPPPKADQAQPPTQAILQTQNAGAPFSFPLAAGFSSLKTSGGGTILRFTSVHPEALLSKYQPTWLAGTTTIVCGVGTPFFFFLSCY